MPFSSEGVEPGVGLALSDGGFRATLFHVSEGVNELTDRDGPLVQCRERGGNGSISEIPG